MTQNLLKQLMVIGTFCHLLITHSYVSSYAQQYEDIKFHHISPNDGLSQSTVFDIVEDSLGYIWIGTAEGLNRYNGNQFEVFTHDPSDTSSIAYDYIRKLHVGHNNTLWVATAKGLDQFHQDVHKFSHFDTTGYPVFGLPNQNVSDIAKGQTEHSLWISTRNTSGIISLFNTIDKTFTHYSNTVTNAEINRLATKDNQVLYMAHSNGLITCYDLNKNTFTKIDSLGQDLLNIKVSRDGSLWVGIDYSGLRVYQPNGRVLELNTNSNSDAQLSNNIPWDMQEDEQGNMWVATDGGLHKISLSETKVTVLTHDNNTEHSLISDFLLSVFIDNNSRIWAGTSASGLSVHDPKESMFHHIRKSNSSSIGLSSNVIWSFESASDSTIFVGTDEGLNLANIVTGSFKKYITNPNDPKSISNNRIWSIAKGNANEYWLGTSRGLNKMVIQNGEATFRSWQNITHDSSTISGNSARCLLLENDTTLWIGTSSSGLNKFEINKEVFTRFLHNPKDTTSLSGTGVRCIRKMTNDQIWVGTNGGLSIIKKGERFNTFKSSASDTFSLSNNNIRVIFESLNGKIWIGTDYGLNLVTEYNERQLKVRRFTTKHGLPNNRIYGILQGEENSIWISTNRGIAKLYTDTFIFENYFHKDGLQGNEFNQLAAHKHRENFYFGGIKGYNYFNPKLISNDQASFPIVFTDLEIEHQPIKIKSGSMLNKDLNLIDKVVLRPGEQSFSIGFKTLNFRNKKKDRYAYFLQGYDKEWYHSGEQNKAVYTNLPPGNYTLKVSTINRGKINEDSILSKNIVIQPYLWQTKWFQFFGWIILILIAYLSYHWRVRSLVQSKLRLEEGIRLGTRRIEEQKEELESTLSKLKDTQIQMIQQEKLASIGELTAGIAHEINNPINFLKNSSEALEYDIDDLNPIFDIMLNVDSLTPEDLSARLRAVKGQIQLPVVINEIRDLVKSIKAGSLRTTEIVKSLRYFSHVNKNKKELINIHDPIESSLVILKNTYKDQIDIHRDYQKDIQPISAKPGKINQVLLNILNNAVQAIHGKGNIWISSKHIDNILQIKIQDDGPGIDNNIKSKIFEPFFTTKKVGSGTGLGLAISQRIIAEHNGTLTVEDRHPKGTIFCITLPYSRSKVLD